MVNFMLYAFTSIFEAGQKLIVKQLLTGKLSWKIIWRYYQGMFGKGKQSTVKLIQEIKRMLVVIYQVSKTIGAVGREPMVGVFSCEF